MRLAVILVVTAVGVVWLYVRGPLPVMRGTTPLPGFVPTWYMLSAFPILGMLVADWMTLVLRRGRVVLILELGAQIGLLVALSGLRIATAAPLSGHTLLFGYFLVRRALVPFPDKRTRKVELGIALVLFSVISYVKLVWWQDVETLVGGVLFGTGLAGTSYAFWRVFKKGN